MAVLTPASLIPWAWGSPGHLPAVEGELEEQVEAAVTRLIVTMEASHPDGAERSLQEASVVHRPELQWGTGSEGHRREVR